MADEEQDEAKEGKIWLRAFRPLLIWTVISVFLLGYDFHWYASRRTFLSFSPRLEGKEIEPESVAVFLNDQRFDPRTPLPLGWHKVRLAMKDVEPVETNIFAWYGENDLGTIDLKRKRGLLDFSITPAADEVRFSGPYHEFALRNSAGTKMQIPVGEYDVDVEYDRYDTDRVIEIRSGKTTHLTVEPDIGIVTLKSKPSDASFALQPGDEGGSTLRGDFPARVSGVPTGKYTLFARRGDYEKQKKLVIEKGQTNQVAVTFEYGRLKLQTDPAKVAVYEDRDKLGRTPTTLSLIPGSHTLKLTRDGFESVEIPIDVQSNETVTISTNLVSLPVANAMKRARQYAERNDYQRALSQLNAALKQNSDYEPARRLREQYQKEYEHYQNAKAAEKRQLEAAQTFRNLTEDIKHASLFDTHKWVFQAELSAVKQAVRRAINQASVDYVLEQGREVGSDTVFFNCEEKGALSRRCAVLVSQIRPAEIQVYAKFWDYVTDQMIVIPIFEVPDDKLTPVHPRYFNRNQKKAVERRRQAIAQEFKKLIEQFLP